MDQDVRRLMNDKIREALQFAQNYGGPNPLERLAGNPPAQFLLHVQKTRPYDEPDRALATVHSEWPHFTWARRAAASRLDPYDWFWVTDLSGRVLLHTYPNALCARCHRDVGDDYYMVTDEVWHAVAADTPDAQYCLACLEDLVLDWRDTPLVAEDFKDIALNRDCPRADRIMRTYRPDHTLP